MINLNDYKQFCESLQIKIGANRFVMVVQEEHLKKKLRDEPGVVLVAVFPSVLGKGSEDNTGDDNTVLVFVLEYTAKSGMTNDLEIESYERTRVMIDKIKTEIISQANKGDNLMQFLNRQSIVIEPEWNIAGSYNGWSITFNFER